MENLYLLCVGFGKLNNIGAFIIWGFVLYLTRWAVPCIVALFSWFNIVDHYNYDSEIEGHKARADKAYSKFSPLLLKVEKIAIVLAVVILIAVVIPTRKEVMGYYVVKEVGTHITKNVDSNFNPQTILSKTDKTLDGIFSSVEAITTRITNTLDPEALKKTVTETVQVK